MANDAPDGTLALVCEGIQMTPTQCNAVIEEKLTHLKPLFERALAELIQVREAISNGDISWKAMLDSAVEKHRRSRN